MARHLEDNTREYLILHTLAFDGDADIAEVRRWHQQRTPPFRDVGYHYLIRRNGRLEIGRQENEFGAHCIEMGMNRRSLGIAFEGHGDNAVWTDAQWATIRRLFSFMNLKYGIPPENVLGHRETGAPKTCPGTKIDMKQVRSALAGLLKRHAII